MLKNGLYNLFTGVVKATHTIVTIFILTRVMGIEEYGVWALTCSIIELFAIAEAGLSVSTTVFLSTDISRNDRQGFSETLSVTFLLMLCIATLAAFCLWQGASMIVLWIPQLNSFQQQTVIAALKIGSISIWAQLLQQICIGVEQACQQYKILNILDSLQIITLGLGWAILAVNQRGITDLITWQVITSLVFLIIHCCFMSRFIGGLFFRFLWNPKKMREVIVFSVVNWLSVLGVVLFKKSDRLIVATVLGPKQLGLYSIIIDSTNLIHAFATRSIQPIVPAITSLSADSGKQINQAEIINKIKSAFQLHSYVATSLGVTFLLLSGFILNIFLQKQPIENILFEFRIAVVITTIYTIGTVGHYLLLSIQMVKICSVIQICASLTSLFLITTGSIKFGLVGAVLGNLGWSVTILLSFIALKRFDIVFTDLLNWIKVPWLFFLVISLYRFNLS